MVEAGEQVTPITARYEYDEEKDTHSLKLRCGDQSIGFFMANGVKVRQREPETREALFSPWRSTTEQGGTTLEWIAGRTRLVLWFEPGEVGGWVKVWDQGGSRATNS